MVLWRCRECTAAYAVGLLACPHCRSSNYEEDGVAPKITVHGGATIHGAWSSEGESDTWPAQSVEGGEEPSPGNSSPPSEQKPQSTSETSEPASRRRARTTASRSKKARTGGSSAAGTDGGPKEAAPAADEAGEP